MKTIIGILSALLAAAGFSATETRGAFAAEDHLAPRIAGTRTIRAETEEIDFGIAERAGIRVLLDRPSAGIASLVVYRCADGSRLVVEEHADGGMSSIVVAPRGHAPHRGWMREFAVLPTADGAIVSRVAAAEWMY